MRERMPTCQNCSRPVGPAQRRYCSPLCRELAANRRRRARRQFRKAGQPVNVTCYCWDCGETFTADKETLTQHRDCEDWTIWGEETSRCVVCGDPALQGRPYCRDSGCFTVFWNRLIPHDLSNSLTDEQIVYSSQYGLIADCQG
jgi:hypothetical protein